MLVKLIDGLVVDTAQITEIRCVDADIGSYRYKITIIYKNRSDRESFCWDKQDRRDEVFRHWVDTILRCGPGERF